MKTKFVFIITLLFAMTSYAQEPCGSKVAFDFDNDIDGSLPAEWIEYNTSGQVSVDAGRLKLDFTTDKPSVYHDFTPVTENFSYAFDIESTRNYTTCYMNLISANGEYLASFTFGLLNNLSIQYASTMSAGVPSSYTGSLITGNFTTNTTYSITANANFGTQTIDIYNNGNLMAVNVPFLETALDVAKIDIQLNLMYSNEGRFFFDNISLISGEDNRLLLTSNVSAAETLLSSVSIGDQYNQYPQATVDAFQLAVDNANTVLADCDATSSTIDTALLDFSTAKDIFDAARINDPVLKIYEGYDFSGEEHEIYCGYYNGTLGDYDDWAVSFTLEKGYMVTFAEDVNGLGISKVYIAEDEDLSINLHEDLQKKTSFIRVSPWKNVRKKGLAAKGEDVVAALDNYWYYNWGTDGEAIGDAEFVPNQWSGGSIGKPISLGERMDITHYMAFNEPDGASQANMTVDVAIERYEYMLASGLRLGSPANKDNAKGGVWRDEFMTKALAKGYRVDYVVVHYYKKTTPQNFYNWLKAIYDKWQRPIWIKEFNYGATWVTNNPPTTNEAASIGLKSYIDMLDDTDFIERYSVFTWQPNNPIYSLMSVRNPVTLSTSGIMYRDHESPLGYTQEVYEQGAQLSVDDNSLSSNILVFPTLVTDGILNLKYSEAIKYSDKQLTIYNTVGQQVKNSSDSSTKVDVSMLSSGLYLIEIKSGLDTFVKRFIVQ